MDGETLLGHYAVMANKGGSAERVREWLNHLPCEQRTQTFLVFVSRLLDSMDESTLSGFRQRCAEGLAPSRSKQQLLDLIDGNRALRHLRTN
jgi:hypothetical protein